MSSPDVVPSPARWSLARRIAFRFVCVLFVLEALPFPINAIPGTEWLGKIYMDLGRAIFPWVGKHILHLAKDITMFPGGSGDTTYNYVALLCTFVLSAVATVAWTFIDKHRPNYEKAHAYLRIYLRYFLAGVMVSYGLMKVIKTQFPFPGAERLSESVGDMSPMGLLWTFMGYSLPYNVFTGGAELLGGVLLFFRRTTTLGALIVAAVMSNVVMMNFCYDVPVKLYSTFLLLTALFLVLPDAERIANVLLLNRPTLPRSFNPLFEARWKNRGALALKVLYIGVMAVVNLVGQVEWYNEIGDAAPRPPLYGTYQVEAFTRDGQELPPSLTENGRWRTVAIDRRERVKIWMMDDTSRRYPVGEDDPEKKTFGLYTPEDTESPSVTFNYEWPDPDHLVLQGSWEGAAVNARLRKVDESKYLLVNRGFHWINELPFNR